MIPTTGQLCDVPGCGIVLIPDGNTKNSHEVCLATHAGYAGFSGLHGRVRTGCPNTPGHKSRWPCGTITMLGELFGTGSKGQVYDYLHSCLSCGEIPSFLHSCEMGLAWERG